MSDELKKALAAITTREPTKFVVDDSAASRIEQLEARLAAAEQNAERYRFVRDRWSPDDVEWWAWNTHPNTPEAKDAAVDTAMKGKQ